MNMRLGTTVARGESTCDLFYPQAYLIGVPRSGTTALASYLGAHPQIAFSKPKEPHFFADDLDGLRQFKTVASYQTTFASDAKTQLLMEGSVWYLYSLTAVPSILRARPDARFVIQLRNPVTMLPSLHRKLLDQFDEDQSDFSTAWSLANDRARGICVPTACRAAQILIYNRTAAYGEMISRLFKTVPQDRCLIQFYEEFATDPRTVYRRTLSFLGIDDDGREDFPKKNTTTRVRSRAIEYLVHRSANHRRSISAPIKRLLGLKSLGYAKLSQNIFELNNVPDRPAPLPDALREDIIAHYRADMQRLADILERDLAAEFGWPI